MLILKANRQDMLSALQESIKLQAPLIFPTDTIYGIGAPLSNIKGNTEIFAIKQRPMTAPFPVLAGSIEQVEQFCDIRGLSRAALDMLHTATKCTFILKARQNINDIYLKNGTIAIRVPDVEWLKMAIKDFGEPVTATSVNITKEDSLNDFNSVYNRFSDKVSIFINGISSRAESSEIYDLTSSIIKKLR